MCRYGMYGPYKQHYACFNCRKMFRHPGFARPEKQVLCPQCRSAMGSMGLDFKAPKQTAKEQWDVVQILYRNNIRYSSCGCGGPGYRPSTKRTLAEFLDKRSAKTPGQYLLQRVPKTRAKVKGR